MVISETECQRASTHLEQSLADLPQLFGACDGPTPSEAWADKRSIALWFFGQA